MIRRAAVKINGIVQGVGFRPFVSRELNALGLCGWIRNTSEGVELELEGEKSAIEDFVSGLSVRAPKLAMIDSVLVEWPEGLAGYEGFEIKPSAAGPERNTLISPDVCICDDCLRELRDPADKRFRYPFINCTNCGPRFTIIRDVPYDRAKTTMAGFPMCLPCDAEYHDITNRRYHAQPTCCPDCGPRLWLADAEGREVSESDPCGTDAVRLAAEALKDGKIVAVKGLGGFHLACRFDVPGLVRELRRRKRRDEKPFAVMCSGTEAASRYVKISEDERRLLESAQRPIVLLEKRGKGAAVSEELLREVSCNGRLGVMLPYTPVHYLLFDALAAAGGPDALIMTSANLSDLPIIYKNEEALSGLHGIADAFLLNDRDIHVRCDDSLAAVFRGKPYFLRRSRGWVPYPVPVSGLGVSGRSILACGAEQKASFALSKGRFAFCSQHIGDLKNIESFENYSFQAEHFKRLFDIEPQLAVCDLHPDYLSTVYAEESGLPVFRAQHHWAHMASCMADNGLEGPVIGIVWDGTGLGTDGSVWGAEFLTGGYTGFDRAGSIRQIPLAGGDICTKELWRVGAALLEASGEDPAEFFAEDLCKAYSAAMRLGVNVPMASSMGRLFDGVSAILGIRTDAGYEGQGAVLLEAEAAEGCSREYPVRLESVQAGGSAPDRPKYVFDWRPMIREICEDLRAGVPKPEIAAGFMNTLCSMAAALALRISGETGLHNIVISGGSFQNLYVLNRLVPMLEAHGFSVYTHSRVSCNDEGLSLGQLMIGERYVSGSTAEDN